MIDGREVDEKRRHALLPDSFTHVFYRKTPNVTNDVNTSIQFKSNTLCTSNVQTPFIERDNEDVPPIPFSQVTTDFVVVPRLYKNEKRFSPFPEGCARSAPFEHPPSLENFALGKNLHNLSQQDTPKSNERNYRNSKKDCPDFNQILNLHTENWENGLTSNWVIQTDQEYPRLLYSGPVLSNTNDLLVAKFKGCVPGMYQARMSASRLMDQAQVGIAFRIPVESTKEFYAVTLCSGRNTEPPLQPYIALHHVQHLKDVKTLWNKKNTLIGPQKVVTLTVIDHGHTGKIQVLLNNKPVVSDMISKSKALYYRAGIFLISGAASLSEIHFSPYEN